MPSLDDEIRDIARYLESNEGESVAEYGKLIRSKLDALGEDCKRIARDDADFARYDSKIDAAVQRAKGGE